MAKIPSVEIEVFLKALLGDVKSTGKPAFEIVWDAQGHIVRMGPVVSTEEKQDWELITEIRRLQGEVERLRAALEFQLRPCPVCEGTRRDCDERIQIAREALEEQKAST